MQKRGGIKFFSCYNITKKMGDMRYEMKPFALVSNLKSQILYLISKRLSFQNKVSLLFSTSNPVLPTTSAAVVLYSYNSAILLHRACRKHNILLLRRDRSISCT